MSRVTLAVRYATGKVALIELPTDWALAPDEACIVSYRRDFHELLEALEIWKKAGAPIV
jgi:hypothetical protein